MTYIARTLTINKHSPDQRTIDESEIATLDGPLIILGEPGIGKSALTASIELMTGAKRVSAGTFYRSENLAPYAVSAGQRLVIDGLDEIAAAGASALDTILRKLDLLGRPEFILSCRAADWQGSADKWKIEQDYGKKPCTLHLEPFSQAQAVNFLQDYAIDAPELLENIGARGLQELSGNPLTLGLFAELALEGRGIPENRTDLIGEASRLLIKEKNQAHQASEVAQAGREDLLLSAGAMAAHLLISGSTGVSTRPRDDLPVGFVHVSDIGNIRNAPLAEATLGSRLFRSESEGLFFPIHRVIAEYWGGYWLAKQLQSGLSERRVFNALEFGGGVPGALRGIHAWLGYFCPAIADRCIRTDPYGVLRYGETAKLPAARARLLLSSLSGLANEDPYFRSEDWGTRAVSGLARPDLKDDIIAVVRSPDRHFHLSTLLLEALPGSTLTDLIIPDLQALIDDPKAAYAERHHAAQALIASNASLDWPSICENLANEGGEDNTRLALEIITQLHGSRFTSEVIAGALVARMGIDRNDERKRVGGLDYLLIQRLTATQCAGILDALAGRIHAAAQGAYWSPNHSITTTILKMVCKTLAETDIAPDRFRSWLKYIHTNSSYSTEAKDGIAKYLQDHADFRRAVQRDALHDPSIDGGPWMAIVHELAQASSGLWLSQADVAYFLDEIGAKNSLDKADIVMWCDLVRSQGRPASHADDLRKAIAHSTSRHAQLAQEWEELQKPPERDFEKEQQQQQAKYLRKQAARFAVHRRNFAKALDGIRDGTARAALHTLASAYLNRYSDLDHEAAPIERLKGWVGEEIAAAATEGFIACLSAADLPTLEQVMEIRKENKHWTIEPILMCGAAELVRQGHGLGQLKPDVARAILAVWWEMPEFNSSKLGTDLETQLEARVFQTTAATADFLRAVIAPQITEDKEHVSNLYRLGREERFRPYAGPLALSWLQSYPSARPNVQFELLQIALACGPRADLLALVLERLQNAQGLAPELRRMWAAAGFLLGVAGADADVRDLSKEDRDVFWSVVNLTKLDDHKSLALTLPQLEYMIVTFAPLWPPVATPGSGWVGEHQPWDASSYVRSSIDRIGTDPSTAASETLDRLTGNPACVSYKSQIMHVRAQQRRLRRDTEYVAPSFEEVRRTLSDDAPGTIDDLKAMMLDCCDAVQKYLRDADTDGWEAFWGDKKPKVENTCRDRLLDALRARTPQSVDLLPECLMPERNRCDILALHQGKGLPIELKGQWHKDVWNASRTQLEDQYGRDWRADGRGIYLVLWFGQTAGKNLTAHPDGLPAPHTPDELKDMLLKRLKAPDSGLIDIAVLDVSKPLPKK